jgi:hypothetical protein
MLAFGQGKSERSIRMTLSLAFIARKRDLMAACEPAFD